MPQIRISSLDDPRIANYRDLKKRNWTRRDRVFIAEGTTVVERLFQSSYEVLSVLISDHKLPGFAHRIPDDVTVYRIERSLAQQLVGHSFHSGVLACGQRKESPKPVSVVPADGPSLIIAADRIIDAENVGSLIRIAAAFGADGVILGAGTTDPFARRVLRVSMGNVLFLPVAEVDCLASTLTDLSQNHGYQTIATVLDATAEDLTQSVMSERVVLVFGNESHGLDPQVAACCNQRMTIPMWNGTDSLNIAIAAGIFAHCYRTAHSGR